MGKEKNRAENFKTVLPEVAKHSLQGLTDSGATVLDWFEERKPMPENEREELLHEVCNLLVSGTAAAFQHVHRPKEFYIYCSTKEATQSLNEVPNDLAMIKLAALLKGSTEEKEVFIMNPLWVPENKGFIESINRLQLSLEEVLLLVDSLIKFLHSSGPLYLSDVSISLKQFVRTYLLAKKGDLRLSRHGLVQFCIEADGVSCRADITAKALALYAGIEENGANDLPIHPKALRIIQPEEVTPVELCLDSQTQTIFRVIKSELQRAASQSITTLLHGPSGTGKTEFVLQLARSAQVPIFQLDIPHIRSKWVGETEKAAVGAFKAYADFCQRTGQGALLFLNEADGLLGPRVNIERGSDLYANQVQNVFLQLLEEFKGVLVATTNYPQNIDGAFKRRFLFWHKLDMPSIQIVEDYLKVCLKEGRLPAEVINLLPREGLTLAQIKRVEQQFALIRPYCSVEQLAEWVQMDLKPNMAPPIGF